MHHITTILSYGDKARLSCIFWPPQSLACGSLCNRALHFIQRIFLFLHYASSWWPSSACPSGCPWHWWCSFSCHFFHHFLAVISQDPAQELVMIICQCNSLEGGGSTKVRGNQYDNGHLAHYVCFSKNPEIGVCKGKCMLILIFVRNMLVEMHGSHHCICMFLLVHWQKALLEIVDVEKTFERKTSNIISYQSHMIKPTQILSFLNFQTPLVVPHLPGVLPVHAPLSPGEHVERRLHAGDGPGQEEEDHEVERNGCCSEHPC